MSTPHHHHLNTEHSLTLHAPHDGLGGLQEVRQTLRLRGNSVRLGGQRALHAHPNVVLLEHPDGSKELNFNLSTVLTQLVIELP